MWLHLHEVSKSAKPIETESTMMVATDWGRGNGKNFNGYRVIDSQDKRALNRCRKSL
jgi:hypothetical protein